MAIDATAKLDRDIEIAGAKDVIHSEDVRERVVAFLHIHVMALMVAALIERKIRLAMQQKRISSLPIYPENRPCKAPTIFDIVRLFRNVERYFKV